MPQISTVVYDLPTVYRNADWTLQFPRGLLLTIGSTRTVEEITLKMHVKSAATGAKAMELTLANERLFVLDTSERWLAIDVPQEVVASIAVGAYRYDVLAIDGVGRIERWLEGAVSFADGITDPF